MRDYCFFYIQCSCLYNVERLTHWVRNAEKYGLNLPGSWDNIISYKLPFQINNQIYSVKYIHKIFLFVSIVHRRPNCHALIMLCIQDWSKLKMLLQSVIKSLKLKFPEWKSPFYMNTSGTTLIIDLMYCTLTHRAKKTQHKLRSGMSAIGRAKLKPKWQY